MGTLACTLRIHLWTRLLNLVTCALLGTLWKMGLVGREHDIIKTRSEGTVLPAQNGGYLTLLSSHSFEIPWDVPLLWNCIMFCHCFFQVVTKPNSLYNRKGGLSTYLSKVSHLISLLEVWSSFLWCSWGLFIPLLNPAVFCCRIHWIQIRNNGLIPQNLERFC